jgi:hypothetical protein
MLPRHPAGTLDQRPCRPGDQAAPQPGRRPSGGPGLGSTLVRASHGQRRTIPCRPARCGQATTPPADQGTSTRCAQPGAARHPEPLQVQRGADSAAAAPRTPEACPSGHLDAPDACTLDAWTPDAWTPDVRSTGWTDVPTTGSDEADRATTGLAGVRTSSRPATTAGRPDLARVTAPGSARPPRLLRGDGTCAAALTAAATGQPPSAADMRPRPGALLSSDDYGSSVEPAEKLHPLCQGARRDRHKLEQARSGFDQGVVSELRAFYSGVRCAGVGWRRRGE